MSANTSIQWTHHTFNPWWGCSEVSPGCENCYARTLAARYMPGFKLWGPNSLRRLFDGDDWKQHWREPIRWNRKAARDGVRRRVFCASMADVFDNHPAVEDQRDELWRTIRLTPHLDWLLLTKRVSNIQKMLPLVWGDGWPNVWLGISVVDQDEAERDIPRLLNIPARVRFLSCEPLLGPIDLRGLRKTDDALLAPCGRPFARIDWVIIGGESGPRARPFNIEWARTIVAQCDSAGVPAFVKQIGANPYLKATRSLQSSGPGFRLSVTEAEIDTTISVRHRAGGDPAEWPEDLRVREFPLPQTRT